MCGESRLRLMRQNRLGILNYSSFRVMVKEQRGISIKGNNKLFLLIKEIFRFRIRFILIRL